MFELVIACFIGILIGTTTGMVPGIHVNTAGAILFASSTFLLTFLSPEFLCVLMVAMSIAHALIEFVPSMLLGVPEEGTATSILPGHRMVLQGRAKEVIRIVCVGGFGAIIVTILMLPVFNIVLPMLHEVSKPFTWVILLFASIYGLYGVFLGFVYFAIHMFEITSAHKPYFYPIAPFHKSYFLKSLLGPKKIIDDTFRSTMITKKNIIRQRRKL